MELIAPGLDRLAAYTAALEAGWSPSSARDVRAGELAMIRADPAAALRLIAREEGGVNTLPDGTETTWLPGRVFWVWDSAVSDDGFCGTINLRYLAGTEDLPPHVSGHVGYSVVPWRRRRGYATRALGMLLPVAAGIGLPRVMVTCDVDNVGSRRVIEANGGAFVDELAGKLRFWVRTGDYDP